MEFQVIAAVVVADALVVAVSIWMDWTPLTNRARRKYLYEKLNLKMWAVYLLFVVFGFYNFYQWRMADELYGGGPHSSWVSLNEHPIYFTWLAIIYSLSTLMFGAGIFVGLAKLLGLWRIKTDIAPK